MKVIKKDKVVSAHGLSLTLILTTMLISSAFISSCGGSSKTSSPTTTSPPPPPLPKSGTSFTDVTSMSGIDVPNGNLPGLVFPVSIMLANGVAAGDFDNDGDIDLFIVRGGDMPNLLYRNDGNLVFTNVATSAGVANTNTTTTNYRHSSPAFADLDGDGDLDLLLPGLGGDPTKIYSNNGNSTFSDITTGSGLENMNAEVTLSPAFGDYDLDGDLDLMFGHWGSTRDYNNPGDTEHLWRNDTDATGVKFTSVSLQAKISPSIIAHTDPLAPVDAEDYTFTPTFARIDDDAYPDILMVADFNHTQIFMNNQDGTFNNVTDPNVIIDGNGMGSAVGDYDNDGDLDWFVSSINGDNTAPNTVSQIGNRLYRNVNGTFQDASDVVGIEDGGWGWGSCFVDFDNDGDLDIYQTNGWPEFPDMGFPTDQTRAWVSNEQGQFTNEATGMKLNDTEQGRGIVCADFDNDGDVDVLQMHLNAVSGATLWRNDTETVTDSNYLSVKLRGVSPNTDAVGARITMTTGTDNQYRDILLGNNYASHNPTMAYFGTGNDTQITSVNVYWPDGKETILNNVAANQKLTIDHPDR